jgi:hypothetical protein
VSSPGMNPFVSFNGRTGMYWMIPCLVMATIMSPGLIPVSLRNFSGITIWYFFETFTVSIVHQTVQLNCYRYKFCYSGRVVFVCELFLDESCVSGFLHIGLVCYT